MTIAIILLGIVFAIIAWQKIDWAVVLVVLSMPIYQLRFSAGSLPMTFLELEILILGLVFLVQAVFLKKYRIKVPAFWWLGLLFMTAAILATFFSANTQSALGILKAYFIEPFLFFIVFVNVIKKPSKMRWVIWALGVLSLYIGLIALWQYMGLLESFEPWISESPKRVTSIFAYPNAVGLILAPIITLLAGMWLLSKNWARDKKMSAQELVAQRKTNTFLIGAVIFGLIGVFCSFTRGAFIGIFLGIVFLSFFSKYKKPILITVACLLLILMIIPFTREMFVSVITGQDVSTDVRTVMWQGTYELLKAHPVMGAGLAGFQKMYDQFRLIKHTELLLYPHNIFLNFWVEIGLLGLVVFVAILVRFFQLGIRSYKKLRNNESLIAQVLPVSLMAAMAVIVLYGQIEVPYFKNDLSVLFWLFLGMITVIFQHSHPKEKPEKS